MAHGALLTWQLKTPSCARPVIPAADWPTDWRKAILPWPKRPTDTNLGRSEAVDEERERRHAIHMKRTNLVRDSQLLEEAVRLNEDMRGDSVSQARRAYGLKGGGTPRRCRAAR